METKTSPHPEWATKFRAKNTELRRISGKYYLYSVKSVYDKEKKRSFKKTLGILGSITEKDGFIASDKNMLREKAISIPKVDTKMYGVYNLYHNLLGDDFDSLYDVFSKETTDILHCVAMFRWSFQSPIKRMSYLHSHDYCSESLAIKGISDKKISAVLKEIGENRTAILTWMKTRMKIDDTAFSKFVMMDSTAVTTVSENIFVNSLGYNPNHSFDKQVRLMYMFSAEQQQPVYYRLINGNITDVKSMRQCVNELNSTNVVFIADKGFYSKKNTEDLQRENLHYIIPLYRKNTLINYSPLKEANYKNIIKIGRAHV